MCRGPECQNSKISAGPIEFVQCFAGGPRCSISCGDGRRSYAFIHPRNPPGPGARPCHRVSTKVALLMEQIPLFVDYLHLKCFLVPDVLAAANRLKKSPCTIDLHQNRSQRDPWSDRVAGTTACPKKSNISFGDRTPLCVETFIIFNYKCIFARMKLTGFLIAPRSNPFKQNLLTVRRG